MLMFNHSKFIRQKGIKFFNKTLCNSSARFSLQFASNQILIYFTLRSSTRVILGNFNLIFCLLTILDADQHKCQQLTNDERSYDCFAEKKNINSVHEVCFTIDLILYVYSIHMFQSEWQRTTFLLFGFHSLFLYLDLAIKIASIGTGKQILCLFGLVCV